MTDPEARGIGDNSDPIGEALEKAERVLEQAARLPAELSGLDEAGRCVALVKMARVAFQKIDEARKAENKPHDKAIKATNDRCRRTQSALEGLQAKGTELVHAIRMRLGLQEIASDFGPKAYGKKKPRSFTIDEALLPDAYWRRQPDNDLIVAMLDAGKTIPGVVEYQEETTVIV